MRLFASVLISLSSLFSLIASAQEADSPEDVVRVRTDLVTVPAYVTDARGRRVAGLVRTDFEVRDNGRPVTLSYFASGTEQVELAFALDASGSIREVINQQREAALGLFSRFGRESRIAVIHFDEKPSVALAFTPALAGAENVFRPNPRPGRRTAIFDAASAAVKFFASSGGGPAARRILILISDGLDNASTVRAPAVINDARRLGVSLYIIHVPLYEPRDGRLSPRPASKGFRDLAEKTGGRYFMVGDAESALDPGARPDLAPVFKAIEEDLQGQYVLGYYPDDKSRGETFHRIEVVLPGRDKRHLRVRPLREEYNLK